MALDKSLTLIPAPKDTMIVARLDGRLYVVDFREFPHLNDPATVDWDISVSKMMVGKLQQNRTRYLTLQEIEMENVVQTQQVPGNALTDMAITVFGSLDGKNESTAVSPSIVSNDGGYVHATCRTTFKNFEIQLRGTYNVNTIVFTYHNHGKR